MQQTTKRGRSTTLLAVLPPPSASLQRSVRQQSSCDSGCGRPQRRWEARTAQGRGQGRHSFSLVPDAQISSEAHSGGCTTHRNMTCLEHRGQLRCFTGTGRKTGSNYHAVESAAVRSAGDQLRDATPIGAPCDPLPLHPQREQAQLAGAAPAPLAPDVAQLRLRWRLQQQCAAQDTLSQRLQIAGHAAAAAPPADSAAGWQLHRSHVDERCCLLAAVVLCICFSMPSNGFTAH